MESMEKEFTKLLNEKFTSKNDEKRKKMVKMRRLFIFIELIVGLMGYVIIAYTFNMWLVLGLFCVLLGNNISMARSITKNDFWEDIWRE
jgi:Na+-translocating ferredoxin:NAD+ oxidoreductase RnfE subunit